jgi:hypothetical protein
MASKGGKGKERDVCVVVVVVELQGTQRMTLLDFRWATVILSGWLIAIIILDKFTLQYSPQPVNRRQS